VCLSVKKSPTETFFKTLSKLKPGRYRVYGHNLGIRYALFLWDVRAKIRDGAIDLQIGEWKYIVDATVNQSSQRSMMGNAI
jgi:hypothetical protein